MDYLLTWRMALAQNLLRRRQAGIAEVAKRVGYGSASTFSVAFSRHVGIPPGQYAEEHRVLFSLLFIIDADVRWGDCSHPAATPNPRRSACVRAGL